MSVFNPYVDYSEEDLLRARRFVAENGAVPELITRESEIDESALASGLDVGSADLQEMGLVARLCLLGVIPIWDLRVALAARMPHLGSLTVDELTCRIASDLLLPFMEGFRMLWGLHRQRDRFGEDMGNWKYDWDWIDDPDRDSWLSTASRSTGLPLREDPSVLGEFEAALQENWLVAVLESGWRDVFEAWGEEYEFAFGAILIEHVYRSFWAVAQVFAMCNRPALESEGEALLIRQMSPYFREVFEIAANEAEALSRYFVNAVVEQTGTSDFSTSGAE